MILHLMSERAAEAWPRLYRFVYEGYAYEYFVETRDYWNDVRRFIEPRLDGWQHDLLLDIREIFNPVAIWRQFIRRLRDRIYRPGGRIYARTMRSFMGTAHEYNKRRRIE